ncbi:MAG: DUF1499 domain-containing protein [Janthinobacterium lividum]
MSKAQAGWMWAGLGVAAAYLGWTNRRLLTVSDVTSGESAAYPTLRSRVYYAEVADTMTAGELSLSRLPGWKLLSRDAENDILEATMSSGLLTDDVTVYFFSLGHGQTRVTIRSRSRAGIGDFGRNTAHVRQLQQAMDDRLNTGSAF